MRSLPLLLCPRLLRILSTGALFLASVRLQTYPEVVGKEKTKRRHSTCVSYAMPIEGGCLEPSSINIREGIYGLIMRVKRETAIYPGQIEDILTALASQGGLNPNPAHSFLCNTRVAATASLYES